MSVLHHVVVAILVLVIPPWDRHETRVLKQSRDPLVRIRSYQKTIAWQVAVGIVLVSSMPFDSLYTPSPDASARMARFGNMMLPVLFALMAGALIPILFGMFKPEQREQNLTRLQAVAFFLPRGGRERWWFAAVCISVGICEELIFRGFLIRYMLHLPLGLSIIPASLAAAVIFGIDHGYQGVPGMLSTGVLALVFTLLFFVSGSLLIPIVMHVLLDLRILAVVPRTWSGAGAT